MYDSFHMAKEGARASRSNASARDIGLVGVCYIFFLFSSGSPRPSVRHEFKCANKQAVHCLPTDSQETLSIEQMRERERERERDLDDVYLTDLQIWEIES